MLELREFDGAESVGSVSKRYMSMKPNIRDSPIQTWGVREDGGSAGSIGSEDLSGLLSPVEVVDAGTRRLFSSSAISGCSMLLSFVPSGCSSRLESLGFIFMSRMSNDGRPWPARDIGLEKSEDIALRVCLWLDTSPALYNVSTPSGMMTMRDVPTNTPIPTVEISRSRDCERGKESGKEPARKELSKISL